MKITISIDTCLLWTGDFSGSPLKIYEISITVQEDVTIFRKIEKLAEVLNEIHS